VKLSLKNSKTVDENALDGACCSKKKLFSTMLDFLNNLVKKRAASRPRGLESNCKIDNDYSDN